MVVAELDDRTSVVEFVEGKNLENAMRRARDLAADVAARGCVRATEGGFERLPAHRVRRIHASEAP